MELNILIQIKINFEYRIGLIDFYEDFIAVYFRIF